jgi:hypothetical protein
MPEGPDRLHTSHPRNVGVCQFLPSPQAKIKIINCAMDSAKIQVAERVSERNGKLRTDTNAHDLATVLIEDFERAHAFARLNTAGAYSPRPSANISPRGSFLPPRSRMDTSLATEVPAMLGTKKEAPPA